MVAVAVEAAFQGAEAMVEVAMAVGATKGVRAATVGASVAAVASPGRHSTTASGDGAAESSAAKSDRRPDRGRAFVVVVGRCPLFTSLTVTEPNRFPRTRWLLFAPALASDALGFHAILAPSWRALCMRWQ